MEFVNRSSSSNQLVLECLNDINELADSKSFSDFSRKLDESTGCLSFLGALDPSLELLWTLIGGNVDQATNTIGRYLDPNKTEVKTYKLDSLALGNFKADGDVAFLIKYVSAYSLLLSKALATIEGTSLLLSPVQVGLIYKFIDDPYELALLGKYDASTYSFYRPNRTTSQEEVNSSSKNLGTLRIAFLVGKAIVENELINLGIISDDEIQSDETQSDKTQESDARDIACGRTRFEQLVFKVCFYEKIIQNIYLPDTNSIYRASSLSVENANTQVKLNSISSDIYTDGRHPSSLEFSPSNALIPSGRTDISDDVGSLLNSLRDQGNCVQSFFNDLVFVSESNGVISLHDNVLHVPPFDEALYASLVKEMHRYTLAELYDKRIEMSDRYSYVGAGIGAVIGLMTFNPLMPFAGGIYGRNFAPKGKRLEEILPDPHLLFAKDQSSFTAMTRSGSSPSRLRRLIFHRIVHPNGNSFFRIIPAIVSASAIIPTQIFRCSEKAYFMRPVNAGIAKDAHPSNYSPIRLQKQYYHLLGDGKFSDTGERMSIIGDDIDGHRYRIYRHSCDTRELDYFYIDYASDPSHVF